MRSTIHTEIRKTWVLPVWQVRNGSIAFDPCKPSAKEAALMLLESEPCRKRGPLGHLTGLLARWASELRPRAPVVSDRLTR